jgi:glutamate/tyrosine decarboxylase-like PLP-dependent enzyme
MAETLQAEPGIRILNAVELNQVVVRFGDGERADDQTRRVIARVQEEGICFAGGAHWKGLWIMRLSVISWATTEQDADRSVAAIVDAWRFVQAEAR